MSIDYKLLCCFYFQSWNFHTYFAFLRRFHKFIHFINIYLWSCWREIGNIMVTGLKTSLIYLTAMSEISFVWNDVVKGGPTKSSGDQKRVGQTEKNKGIENFVNAICWILFAVEAKVSFLLRLRNIEEDSLDFKPSMLVFIKCCRKYCFVQR